MIDFLGSFARTSLLTGQSQEGRACLPDSTEAPHTHFQEQQQNPAKFFSSETVGRALKSWGLTDLRFRDPRLEDAFRSEDWLELLPFARICYITGALLWTLFAILDIIVARHDLVALWVIRFGIGLPILLSAAALTFVPQMQPRLQNQGLAVGVVCGLSIVAMVAFSSPPASHLYYVGVILVVIYAYTFSLIRFSHAIPYGIVIFVIYEAVAIVFKRTPFELVVNSAFFLLSSIYIGIFACYTMERHRRQVFLQRTELAKLTRQLEDLSVHDPLTGLYNRRQLASHLLQECERHHRDGASAAVMLLDLDDFKAVNDRYGHLAGDELLRRTARAIGATVRASDIAFRYGGDEFLVLLPDTTLTQAEELARRLVARMSQFGASSSAFDDATGVSVGVAAINDVITHPDDLLHAADRALYRAKQQGKGRVMVSRAEP